MRMSLARWYDFVTVASYNLGAVAARSGQPGEKRTPGASGESPQAPPESALSIPYPVTLVRGDDGEAGWTATIEALPDCRGRGATPDEALERVAAAMEAFVDSAKQEGRDVPDPKPQQSYSGRLLLRMPQTLHAELARAAERERISLNQFITDALSGALGWRSGAREAPRGTRAVPTEEIDVDQPLGDPEPRERTRFASAVFVANGVIVALAAVVAVIVVIAELR
jgi:antitoxin HicB